MSDRGRPVTLWAVGVRAPLLSLQPIGSSTNLTRARGPEIAGFYVNWDDNSVASFRAHTGGRMDQLTS